MNQVLTSSLLKGLEAAQKVNKLMGKSSRNNATITINQNELTVNSVYFTMQSIVTMPAIETKETEIGVLDVEKLVKGLSKFDTYTKVEISEDKAILTDGKKKIQVLITDSDLMLERFKNNPITVDGVRLESSFTKVKKSVAQEEIRPILCGIHFKNNYIETVDGYRISQVNISDTSFTHDFTVLPKPLEIILPTAKKNKLDVVIDQNESMCMLKTECKDYTFTIIANTLQGEFLNTEQVLSGDYEYLLSFSENKELLQELGFIKDMAGVSASGKAEPVRYILNNNGLSITDSSENTITSAATKIVEMKSRIKDNFKIAFNPNYMIDAIKNISGEFTMQFISALTPITIKNENEKYLVLPIKIKA